MPNIQLINDIKVRRIPCPIRVDFFRVDLVHGTETHRFVMAWNAIQEMAFCIRMF